MLAKLKSILSSVDKFIGLLMSVMNGALFGTVFTVMNQLKNAHRIIVVPLILSVFVSIIISCIVSFIINPKRTSDKIANLFHLNSVNTPVRYMLLQTLLMSIIFTFFIGGIMMLNATHWNFQAFIFGFLLKSLWLDSAIAFVLSLIFHPLFAKVVNKASGFNALH